MHYARWKKYGDVNEAAQLGDQTRKYKRDARCVVEGCERTYERAGQLCNMHYLRIRRHGDPQTTKRTQRSPEPSYVDSRGYVVERWLTGHPLAGNNGHVRRGRRVLFAESGYGPHRCVWCAKHVNWGRRGVHRLEVDHLNWDRADDANGNLVASCTSCNSRRKKPTA